MREAKYHLGSLLPIADGGQVSRALAVATGSCCKSPVVGAKKRFCFASTGHASPGRD
jgi:hypothetical protein